MNTPFGKLAGMANGDGYVSKAFPGSRNLVSGKSARALLGVELCWQSAGGANTGCRSGLTLPNDLDRVIEVCFRLSHD